MFVFVIILSFLMLLVGMALSVGLFGTGGKKSRVFQDIYFSVEDVDGIGVVYSKNGEYSAILKMENPVRKYSAETEAYYDFTALMASAMQTLGEGYALHKQDVFVRRGFNPEEASMDSTVDPSRRYLSDSYFRFFKGRQYVSATAYLIITQENKKSALFSYDDNKWRDFLVKIIKVRDLLHEGGVRCHYMNKKEAKEHVDRFFALNFKDKHVSMTNFKVSPELIKMGDRQCKIYSLLDVDEVALPGKLRPYMDLTVNNSVMPVDLLSEIDTIPEADTVVYNQMIFMPNQRRELAILDKKKNRHASIPNPGNVAAVEDIKAVQEVIAREGKQLVYAHFNLMVVAPADKDMQKVTNHLENIFARQGMHISKRAYNQLELFVASFPGNCYRLNASYDRFLTLSEAALCMLYKERQATGDDSPLKCYYTDRQGLPLAVDITGKEGKVKYTNNSNFFVLGPSGSGKSFFTNSMVRQLYEQNTDIVIVDTGDSYELQCAQHDGVYISYSKESPISMNPFKITEIEYNENFGEKKNFLKSLIFLIFKGDELPNKIEETLINQTIVEYYHEYFTPFKGFTEQDRKDLREQLLLEDKKNGEYEKYEHELELRYGDDYTLSEEDLAQGNAEERERNTRRAEKLQAFIADEATTAGEKNAASNLLMRLTPEVVENKYLQRIDRQIEKIETQRKKLRVTDLSFNSYYEYALQRIPQITSQDRVSFPINDFAKILKSFYRGGELEYVLNNDMDTALFDEKFIVFEIDKVKDDKILFPIIVLIIMDVFTQKMRIKKGRKCLVIEEAWKAIATPVMADYIKYLYKTARKHWAMVGVVTQEIQDITGSPIVKEAIINNSDVFMLLDQSKFKDKFDDIRATLALTDVDCRKIFTINRLDNKDGRQQFKEVFIRRGMVGDVYGIEEPRECYMTYTTDKIEKNAIKLYREEMRCSFQDAIRQYVQDWNRSGIPSPTAFAQKVIAAGHVLRLPTPKQ